MDKGDGWQQLRPVGDPVSYFDPLTSQHVTGSFEGHACATAVKTECGADVAAVSAAAGQHGMAIPPGGAHPFTGAHFVLPAINAMPAAAASTAPPCINCVRRRRRVPSRSYEALMSVVF